jgi:hypothetical protein
MDWLRWYHGTIADPKWRVIARKSGRPITEVIAVWGAILENASQSPKRGHLSGWDSEDVAAALDTDAEHVDAILAAMRGKVLNGDELAAWEKRNPKREDDSADRVRRYREARQEMKRSVTHGNAEKRDGNAVTLLEKRREEVEADVVVNPVKRAHAREANGSDDDQRQRLRSWLGDDSAVDRFAVSAEHTPTWPASIFGSFGPAGRYLEHFGRAPPEKHPAIVARAMADYADKGEPYKAALFRGFVKRAAAEVEKLKPETDEYDMAWTAGLH